MIPSSELIIRPDGRVFHLNMLPEELADKVILVGDPGRVDVVASRFDSRESESQNREFHAVTGVCHGKRITVLSTGIGTDNIDIVMNELDALANVDFSTREVRSKLRTLEIVRVGTCGGMQPDTPIGAFVASQYSIGIDGILNFYAGRDSVSRLEIENTFVMATQWNPIKASPYVIEASEKLLSRICSADFKVGMTVSANGFYAPQGRVVRLQLDDPDINEKIRAFSFRGLKVLNYEMEGSLIAGLGRLLGHRALTVCCVIANRYAREADTDYKGNVERLVSLVLDRI